MRGPATAIMRRPGPRIFSSRVIPGNERAIFKLQDDLVRLERRGVATAGVGTEPFVDEALEQAAALGLAAYRMVLVPHPVQLLDEAGVHALADAAWPAILASLTRQPTR